MFRFTIRDVLWLTALVAMGCLLLVQQYQHEAKVAQMQSQIDAPEKLSHEPRSVTVNNKSYALPNGKRTVIVRFGKDGSVSTEFPD
jgi:hypothetical protein